MFGRKASTTRLQGLEETAIVRRVLIGVALAFVGLFLVMPLAVVFAEAFDRGVAVYLAAVAEPYARAAVRLTLLTALIAVPLNLLFGVAAAWAIARFEFRGKRLLVTVIDLPISVSPVISGMLFVLLFGAQGLLGPWLQSHGIRIIFALPGIVLATVFVTSPIVARELIPLMLAQGDEEEVAAATLGAGGFRTFLHISLPKIRWGLFYGVVLCNARAMGEFGAVSVVSGHIRGQNDHRPAARRNAVQRVPTRGRLRGRVAAHAAGRGHARSEEPGRVERSGRPRSRAKTSMRRGRRCGVCPGGWSRG